MDTIELGQIEFGNPMGEYDCPEYVEALIAYIFKVIERIYWNNNQVEWNRFEDPEFEGIEYRNYYWGDNEEEKSKPNFAYKDVELRWYKWFGRGMSLNVSKTPVEWVEWFDDCLEHIRKQEME
jgi:hypothetical protein